MPDEASNDKKEAEPTPNRILKIKNEFPGALADAIENQYHKTDLTGLFQGFLGERVGFLATPNQQHLLKGVETRIHGSMMYAEYEDIPESHGSKRGVGEERKEFNIKTTLEFLPHTYINNEQAAVVIQNLEQFGYSSRLGENMWGTRLIIISTPEGNFELFIHEPDADTAISGYRSQIEEKKQKGDVDFKYEERKIQETLNGEDVTIFKLNMSGVHANLYPDGIPQESKEQVVSFINRAKDLTEAIATALVQTIGNGKRYPEVRMDWLPPEVVNQMSHTRFTTEVTGNVDPVVGIRTEIQEGRGLEKLPGLAPETVMELKRIVRKLNEPQRAAFMKKYGFKQSNGAVFWGISGSGKSLAGEAVAEEAGCERVVLKVDEYLTAFIHESARKIGERLREIKTKAAENKKTIVVQIDEADTILVPVDNSPVSGRDAAEIRGVLLREFEEPSNVFFLLTTNLDPRDPLQTDPAIVRNQRLGYLVGFGLPTPEGRQEILEAETNKRTGENLRWENINFGLLAQSADGFSPADIQEVLSIAANEAYDLTTDAAFVSQTHLEKAVEIVKSRKLQTENIKRRMGLVPEPKQ